MPCYVPPGKCDFEGCFLESKPNIIREHAEMGNMLCEFGKLFERQLLAGVAPQGFYGWWLGHCLQDKIKENN